VANRARGPPAAGRVKTRRVLFGSRPPRCQHDRRGGDDQRPVRTGEGLAHRLDGAPVRAGRALEVPGARHAGVEREVDHAIRRPGRTAQAAGIVKIAAMYPDPGLGEGGGRGVRAGEAGDLVARTDELGNKGGADPAGRASDKNTHA
jgi:hypothetical protein